MAQNNLKYFVEQALKDFSLVSTSESVKHLFETLGYSTQREVMLDTHTPDEVVEVFGWENFREDKGLLEEWESVDCLFQVTEDEIRENPQLGLFKPSLDKDYLSSYVFMGLTLQNPSYSRSQLANITREVNRQSDIPIMVLFRYGEVVTLSIINRRPNQLDRDKDVLEKVTLIKDININSPHRAHIEILSNLALVSLQDVRNFDQLHTAWQKVLDTSELNKKFFQEVSNWYFWAIFNCSTGFQPVNHDNKQDACATEVFVLRLITRLIFVWFLKEKGLVPNTLFDENEIKGLLKSLESAESTYYKAILQNLFFATLNTEMNTAKKPDNRKFRGKTTQKGGRDQHYGITNVYRYQDYFVNSDEFLELCSNIPFLNGGLFECLDKIPPPTPLKKGGMLRIDGFSDREDNPLSVPNVLFFGKETDIDLNKIYGTKNKKYKVQGLIEIFNRYKFTIDENTPIEEEIALDPELLGKVFENLLAEYNPETETTARKQTGSFYTPREIVNYMVYESLIAYLVAQASSLYDHNTQDGCATVEQASSLSGNKQDACATVDTQDGSATLEDKLRHLLAYNNEPHQFNDQEVEYLINAIDNVKIIDIACGSGAFPMGILQKLVFILGKLDPNNSKWKQQQKEKVIQPVLKDIQVAKQISYEEAREEAIQRLQERLAEIEREFENNEMDYPRKLFLIENCIFGVDIQPIAVQIAKLRFFISLIVDQKVNDSQPNRGILPLPNLETKFVAANSLIGIETAQSLRTMEVIEKEEELKKVRQQHFTARTPKTKKKCREKDEALRQEISKLLKLTGLETATADTLARWNPYDLNASSDFFDAEWMFGVSSFDICIGNPPYGAEIKQDDLKKIKKRIKDTKNNNSASLFIDIAKNILINTRGVLAFIVPKSLLYSGKWYSLVKVLSINASVLVDVEKAFENVFLEQVVFIFCKGKKRTNYFARKFINGSFINNNMINIEDSLKFLAWICGVSKQEISLGLRILNSSVLMKTISQTTRGLPIQKYLKSQGDFDVIGGKNIVRYGIDGIKGMISEINLPESDKLNLLKKPKIISQNIVAHIENPKPHLKIISSVDLTGNILSLDTVNNTILDSQQFNLKFIAALFNSALVNWYAYNFIYCSAIRTMHFDNYYVGKIPIPDVTLEQQEPIIKVVNKILEIKRQNPKANTSDLEKEIDEIVYQLYGLSEEEIGIIEESVKR